MGWWYRFLHILHWNKYDVIIVHSSHGNLIYSLLKRLESNGSPICNAVVTHPPPFFPLPTLPPPLPPPSPPAFLLPGLLILSLPTPSLVQVNARLTLGTSALLAAAEAGAGGVF